MDHCTPAHTLHRLLLSDSYSCYGPNPYSSKPQTGCDHNLQTAPPEAAENQGVLVNIPVQGRSWRLGKAECKVKSNFVNHSIIFLPKYKHVRSLQTPPCLQMFAEGWETCYRASSKPSLLDMQLMDRWGIHIANTISDTIMQLTPSLRRKEEPE